MKQKIKATDPAFTITKTVVEQMLDNEYNLISSADWITAQGYDLLILTGNDYTASLQIELADWNDSTRKTL